MTREEQIIQIGAQFAIDATDGQTSGRAASMRGVLLSAFKAGAHWADFHPQWIPVDEKLPEENQMVWIFTADGKAGIARYDKEGFNVSALLLQVNVTHWMEIVPPRKEE